MTRVTEVARIGHVSPGDTVMRRSAKAWPLRQAGCPGGGGRIDHLHPQNEAIDSCPDGRARQRNLGGPDRTDLPLKRQDAKSSSVQCVLDDRQALRGVGDRPRERFHDDRDLVISLSRQPEVDLVPLSTQTRTCGVRTSSDRVQPSRKNP